MLRRMQKATVCAVSGMLVLCGCSSSPPKDVLTYPPARSVEVVDDYHGTLIPDPYRWLEDLESEEVRGWAAAQRRLVDTYLEDDPVRALFRGRLRELGEPLLGVWEAAQSESIAGLEFAVGATPAGDGEVLIVTSSTAQPRILVDPASLGDGMRLSWFRPSPDGKLVVYAVSEGGSEWVQTRICDVASGLDL